MGRERRDWELPQEDEVYGSPLFSNICLSFLLEALVGRMSAQCFLCLCLGTHVWM